MSAPRIALLPAEDALKAAQQAEVPEQIAELNVFRVLLHHPRLAKRVNDLLMTLLFRGSLDRRLRELVIMRIGWATGSVYEWTQHWRIALQLGVGEEDLLAVRDWRAHAGWSAADRAVLAATDETLERGAITAETWAECVAALPGVDSAARAVARETARIAFAPSRSLFGVPSSSIMVRSRSSCSRASKPRTASQISVLIDSTAPSTPFPKYRPASPSRRSTASCSPVEAPLGTAARPLTPVSNNTSASTVGFPRESRISRPFTSMIADTPYSLASS